MRWTMVLLCGWMVACGGTASEGPARGTRTDSAGIAIWSIPSGEHAAPIQLERVGGLALPDSGWDVWVDDVAADPDAELLYLLDQASPRVLVFGFDGRFLRQVGRKGKGPNEYDQPNALTVEPGGTLAVFDPGTGSIRRWDRGGEYRGSQPLSPGYWGPGLAASPDGFTYTTAGGEETGTMVEALVTVGADGVDTLATVESHWKPLEMPCGRVPVPEVFSLSSVWGARGTRVVSASVPRYELTVRDSGTPTTLYRWETPPRAVSQEEAEASVVSGPLSFLVQGCGMTAAGVVKEAGWVKELSPIFLLSLDSRGRTWAARGVMPDVEAIDVFDPDDRYVGTIRSTAFPVLFLNDGTYLTIVRTDWGTTAELWRVITPTGAF